MLNDMVTNNLNNCKPENPFVVRQKGVVTNVIHSQAFLFGEDNMGKFIRKDLAPLCACGCGKRIKQNKWNKKWAGFIQGHNRKGAKHSAETRKKLSLAATNKKHSTATKVKIGIAHKGSKRSATTRKKMAMAQMGKIFSDITIKKMSLAAKGNTNLLGYKHTEETKAKMSLAATGENSSQWKGGISCEPYCEVWLDRDYKNSILDRDNNECQNPDCWKTSDKLCGHHIDYNKKNCDPNNVIILCNSCNARANSNREWWQNIYQEIMAKKYGYKYAA